MKKELKKKVLQNLAVTIEKVAVEGGGFPTWLGFYEPKMPEGLKYKKKVAQ